MARRRSRQSLIFRATDPFGENWKTRAASERDSRSSKDMGFRWPRPTDLEGTFHTEKLVRVAFSPFIFENLKVKVLRYSRIKILASKIICELHIHNIANRYNKSKESCYKTRYIISYDTCFFFINLVEE